MSNPLARFTRRQIAIGILVLIVIVIAMAYCNKACAADAGDVRLAPAVTAKSSSKMAGEFFVPISVIYLNGFGGAAGVGYTTPRGISFSLQGLAVDDDGQSGTTMYEYRRWQRVIGYTTPSSTRTGAMFTIAIPLTR